MWKLLFHPTVLLIVDAFLCGLILLKIPYTEIDWVAYMQEVRGVIDGEYNYINLKGDTGPLVYPAGFVYIYQALYYISNLGKHVFLAQLVFGLVYLFNQSVVMRLYARAGVTGPLLVALITSRRVHSLFLLRMFNDGVAISLAYVAIWFFAGSKSNKWRWFLGCVMYSLAVSVKMNIFLFAPALLFLLLKNHSFVKTVLLLAVCGIVQVVLALPFLAHNWVSYLSKAFELSRVFTYKWTVNYKFLPEELFVSKPLGIALLAMTVVSWLVLYLRRWRHRDATNPIAIITTLFESNVAGVILSRTMHYQFYAWFYHQLPLVLFLSCTKMPITIRIAVLATVEYAFVKYPSTELSSGLLMASLFTTLFFMLISNDDTESIPSAVAKQAAVTKKKKQ